MTTEAEAQTENRVAEDQTMTEEASFQTRSHTATDLPTEEKEEAEVVDMVTTMIDGQWVVETDSKEDLKVDQMASHTAALGRESTTVTASTAIKRVTSLSTAASQEEKEEIVAAMVDTVEATEVIEEIEEIEETEETDQTEAAAEATMTIVDKEVQTEVKIEDQLDKKTTLKVSESVE